MLADEASFGDGTPRRLVAGFGRIDGDQLTLVADLLEPTQDLRGDATPSVCSHGDDAKIGDRLSSSAETWSMISIIDSSLLEDLRKDRELIGAKAARSGPEPGQCRACCPLF